MSVISHIHLPGQVAEAQRGKVIGPRSQPGRMVVLEHWCLAHLMSAAFLITKITVIHRKLPMGRKDLLYNNTQVVIIFDSMLVMSLQMTTVRCLVFFTLSISSIPMSSTTSFISWTLGPHYSSQGSPRILWTLETISSGLYHGLSSLLS